MSHNSSQKVCVNVSSEWAHRIHSSLPLTFISACKWRGEQWQELIFFPVHILISEEQRRICIAMPGQGGKMAAPSHKTITVHLYRDVNACFPPLSHDTKAPVFHTEWRRIKRSFKKGWHLPPQANEHSSVVFPLWFPVTENTSATLSVITRTYFLCFFYYLCHSFTDHIAPKVTGTLFWCIYTIWKAIPPSKAGFHHVTPSCCFSLK